MPSVDEIIEGLLTREGGYTNDPTDKGSETIYGLSKRANPDLWKDGPPSLETARAVYKTRYIAFPKFDLVPTSTLQVQLIDWGVNSGPYVAITNLQQILNVTVDGVIGPETLKALAGTNLPALNNLLMAARIKMLGRVVRRDPSQVKFLSGWLSRALSFLEIKDAQ